VGIARQEKKESKISMGKKGKCGGGEREVEEKIGVDGEGEKA